MAQFVWHDGSMKNIHVDMTQLYDYQKQLGAQVKLYESRIDWLSSSSRKIFGSVVEDKSVPQAPRFVAFTSLFNGPFTHSLIQSNRSCRVNAVSLWLCASEVVM